MSRRSKPFPFFLWHRRLGLLIFILVFVLAITGIMLNHTEDLKMDEVSIDADFILDWYEINPAGTPVNFKVNAFSVSQWNKQLFFNGRSFFVHHERVRGITQLNNIIAIALKNNVLLVDNQGEIIELMHVELLAPIKNIGRSENKIALLDEKDHYYLSDADLVSWHSHKRLNTDWSEASPLNEITRQQLQIAFRGEGLNLERVILDLHSGRLFNSSFGIYIMDASAIIMMLLGLSGVWIWWSRQLRMRKKKHYKKHHKTR